MAACTKGGTSLPLSPAGTRRNPHPGERSRDPRGEAKTPWSFTAACRWTMASDVERRWEAVRRSRQGAWSRQWNTTLPRLWSLPERGQRQVGSLGGAPRPRKNIEGAQRSAQPGQNSGVECKGKSRPDVTPHTKGSRAERRA